MPWCLRRRLARLSGAALLVGLMAIGPAPAASAQAVPDAAAQPAAPAPAPAPTDPLGRDTPRGTVLGFLNAGKDAKSEIAVQYLRTDLKGADAAALSHQLFTVLDARLPAKLAKLSDAPEGSRANPLKINEEVVGTVERAGGSLDIIVERVEQPTGPAVWLFSAWTLKSIPDVYDEVSGGWGNTGVGQLLNSTRLRRARHFEWLAVVLCLPLFYFVTALLNKLLTPLVRRLWQRFFPQSDFVRKVLPAPIRLVVVALSLRWFLASVSLSLFVRQAGATAANLILLTGLAWLLIQLNGEVERNVRRRLPSLNAGAGIALLRLVRRFADIVVVFLALLLTLRLFAIDPTPALAGLGVGGIAIALAAQKTLENVIAGVSLIVDQAVRVGDTLKMGDVVGTVDHIGLRSTRIRTLDRTVVSIPNSQIANVTLETLSVRDKFWFHPVIGLRYETKPQQLRDIIDGIAQLAAGHPAIEKKSVRVRFLRLGAYSLDVEVVAYVLARDWDHFLEVQEQLLFGVTDLVSRAGAEMAFPSQTMYVANTSTGEPPVAVARAVPAR
jgi:MscS family membrane protein